MKGFKIFFVLFFLSNIALFAQDYKKYKTEKKETLKEIAAKFNVDYDELRALNPDLNKRVKKNTEVKIPVTQSDFKNSRDLQPIDFRPNNKEDLITVAPSEQQQGIHKVKPKETLYGLSKLYKISMATLIKMNPFLADEGLKVGQELQVPLIQNNPAAVSSVKVETVVVNKEHLVKAGETLYGISRLYSVTVESINKANPTVAATGLKTGAKIIVPIQEKTIIKNNSTATNRVEVKVPNVHTHEHIVAEGETLYGIAKDYGISISEILRVNDALVVEDIDVGTAISIPSKQKQVDYFKSDIAPIFKNKPIKYTYKPYKDSIGNLLLDYNISMDSLHAINPSLDSILFYGGDILLGFKKEFYLFEDDKKMKDSIVTDKKLSVMIMLPFEFKKNDTLKGSELFSRENSLPDIVTDFYLGAEMAIDSLKKQGAKIILNVVDTEKSIDNLHPKMDSIVNLKPDLIIGPLYSGNAMYVATHFPSIPVYYPVYSKKQSGFTNFNLVKTATSKDLFKNEMLSFIKNHRKDEHLIIVGDQGSLNKLNAYKKELSKKDSSGFILDDDISLLTLSKNGFFKHEDIIDKVKPNKTNWVLIADDYNPITDGIFSVVNRMSRDEELKAKFRIMSFERLNFVDKLTYLEMAKYQYTYATDNVEYETLLDVSFVENYKNKNNAYPGKYAVRGFAVTYDAIVRKLSDKQHSVSGASQRLNHAFYYHHNGFPTNGNQVVFINMVENTKENGLRVVRLK